MNKNYKNPLFLDPATRQPIKDPVCFSHPQMRGYIYDRKTVVTAVENRHLESLGITSSNFRSHIQPAHLMAAIIRHANEIEDTFTVTIAKNHLGEIGIIIASLESVYETPITYTFPIQSVLCRTDGFTYSELELQRFLSNQSTKRAPGNNLTIKDGSLLIQDPVARQLREIIEANMPTVPNNSRRHFQFPISEIFNKWEQPVPQPVPFALSTTESNFQITAEMIGVEPEENLETTTSEELVRAICTTKNYDRQVALLSQFEEVYIPIKQTAAFYYEKAKRYKQERPLFAYVYFLLTLKHIPTASISNQRLKKISQALAITQTEQATTISDSAQLQQAIISILIQGPPETKLQLQGLITQQTQALLQGNIDQATVVSRQIRTLVETLVETPPPSQEYELLGLMYELNIVNNDTIDNLLVIMPQIHTDLLKKETEVNRKLDLYYRIHYHLGAIKETLAQNPQYQSDKTAFLENAILHYEQAAQAPDNVKVNAQSNTRLSTQSKQKLKIIRQQISPPQNSPITFQFAVHDGNRQQTATLHPPSNTSSSP